MAVDHARGDSRATAADGSGGVFVSRKGTCLMNHEAQNPTTLAPAETKKIA
jgi:hypothetical protein